MFSSKRSGDTEPLIDWACLPDNDFHGDKGVNDERTDPSIDVNDDDDDDNDVDDVDDDDGDSDGDDDDDDDDGRAQQIRSGDG